MFSNGSSIPVTMNVAPTGTTNGCSGFGNGWGDGSWWIILLIIILFGGWGWGGYGNGGFGGGSRESTSVYEGYVLNNDMSMLNKAVTDSYSMTERKLDGISNGLCDGFYTQAQLINGIDKSIANSNYAIQNAIQQDTIAGMQNTNAIQTQLAQCCCDNRQSVADVKYTIGSTGADISRGIERGFSDTNYNMATQANGITNAMQSAFCQTNFNAQTNTRDIVDSQNAGTQAILARIDAMEASRKDEKIAELTAQLNRADLAASQAAQNSYLIDQLGQKVAQPCYVVPNPYCNCNCNSGCGC